MNSYTPAIPTTTPIAKRKPRRWRWLKRTLLGLLLLLRALCLVGTLYQAIATDRDARAFPTPGQLIDVGGYRLHLHCMGTGNPTVILESGQANSVSVWTRVQPAVAKLTCVCAYDRAGVGWSEAGPEPRDASTWLRNSMLCSTRPRSPRPMCWSATPLAAS